MQVFGISQYQTSNSLTIMIEQSNYYIHSESFDASSIVYVPNSLKKHKDIIELTLRSGSIKSLNYIAGHCLNLKKIIIYSPKDADLNQLAKLKQLEDIAIFFYKPVVIEQLSFVKKLPHLTHLSINRSNINNQSLAKILPNLYPGFKGLKLIQNNISLKGVETIIAVLPDLIELNLDLNYLNKTALILILEKLRKLEQLSLSSCIEGPGGLGMIIKSGLKLKALSYLGNKVQDKELFILPKLKRLNIVDVMVNPVEKEKNWLRLKLLRNSSQWRSRVDMLIFPKIKTYLDSQQKCLAKNIKLLMGKQAAIKKRQKR